MGAVFLHCLGGGCGRWAGLARGGGGAGIGVGAYTGGYGGVGAGLVGAWVHLGVTGWGDAASLIGVGKGGSRTAVGARLC